MFTFRLPCGHAGRSNRSNAGWGRRAAMVVAFAIAAVAPMVHGADGAPGERGFYQQPTLFGDRLVFVSEGDLWSATLPSDPALPIAAHRLTATSGAEGWPCFSPDGASLAFAAERDGNTDVYVMPVDGGPPRRLTFHPGPDVPLAWTPDGKSVVFRSARTNPLGRTTLWRVEIQGGTATEFAFGECSLASFDSAGARIAFTRWSNETWNWRNYRGGTAPDLWLWDVAAGRGTRLVKDPANDLFPMFYSTGGAAERVAFASDRDGQMNIWSVDATGGDLRQHTRFRPVAGEPTAIDGYDVRWPRRDAATNATRVVFAQGARLAIVDLKDDSIRRLDVTLAGDRPQTLARFVDPMPTLTEFALDGTGSRLVIGSRGEFVSVPVGDPKLGSRLGAVQLTRSSAAREWGATIVRAPDGEAAPKDRAKDAGKPGAKAKAGKGGHAEHAEHAQHAEHDGDSSERVVFITDAGGEQQIAQMPLDGSSPAKVLTDLPAAWLMPPQASPDGRYIAFGDMDLNLWLFDTTTREKRLVDTAAGGEINDYRFSPDSRWLVYTKPLANGYSSVMLHSIEARSVTPVSDGLSSDSNPRWDPRGKYLYLLSKRHFNPILSEVDMEHAFTRMTEITAYPLAKDAPPPTREAFHAAGLEIDEWASGDEDEDEDADDAAAEAGATKGTSAVAPTKDASSQLTGGQATGDPAKKATKGDADAKKAPPPLVVDPEGIDKRRFRLGVDAGNYANLEAIRGGVLFVSRPVKGMADDVWPAPLMGVADGTLKRFDAADVETTTIAPEVGPFAISGDARKCAFRKGDEFVVRGVDGSEEEGDGGGAKGGGSKGDGAKGKKKDGVDVAEVRMQIDPRVEWRQILDEAWRLQRDFYWDPNMRGLDWKAVREKYVALLPRVGTRSELNTLVGMLIGELGTSHTYVWGGEQAIPGVDPEPVKVGQLGVDLVRDGDALRIERILPDHPWDARYRSPLAAAWLRVKPGMYLLAIDGQPIGPRTTADELLQNRAGKPVRLTLADDAAGAGRRDLEIVALADEQPLRYSAWVEANRRRVDEASGGALGYMHLPDMDSDGLIAFSQLFFPQVDKKGLVVDIRDNGGGFVSQMIIARLNRKVWAFDKPRHGAVQRYPLRALDGHLATIIDEHAGSDGDIFPESFRILGLGPLIGTRTWGGVVGIRGDKPFVDMGLSTQPEFAWWEPKRGWSLENSGVAPDIEVEVTPDDRAANRDPQLERTIQVLLEKLKEDPRNPPQPPAAGR
ncbi:MAG: PDZ domain-containing protein [Phycisphaerales bacterium]